MKIQIAVPAEELIEGDEIKTALQPYYVGQVETLMREHVLKVGIWFSREYMPHGYDKTPDLAVDPGTLISVWRYM